MPRQPRLEVSGALYHVTARGNERRALFRDDVDRLEYLARAARYRERFRFRLLAYCLMTNHVHLAIRTGQEPLSRIIAGLHSSYAEWFNRRHDRVGHLFQGRYKAFLVQEDRRLHALVRYIHLNPVKARIADRASDYPWSSDRFLRRGRGPEWLDVDHLLSLLDETRRSAVRRYVDLVDGPSGDASYDPGHAIDQAVIGDEDFALTQWEAAASSQPKPRSREVSLDRVLDAVARECGLTLDELRSGRRGGKYAAARCLAVYVARLLCGASIRRVALRLGRDDSSFVRPLAELERRLDSDQALRTWLDRVAKALGPPPTRAPNRNQQNQD
jgi:REP element-mobilizing transposase RayT